MATPPACICVTKESPEQAIMVIHKFLWGTYLDPNEDASPISGKNEGKEQARPGNTLQVAWKEPKGPTQQAVLPALRIQGRVGSNAAEQGSCAGLE